MKTQDSKTKIINFLIEAREILMELDKHYSTSAYEPEYAIGTHDIEIAKMLQQEAVNELLKE